MNSPFHLAPVWRAPTPRVLIPDAMNLDHASGFILEAAGALKDAGSAQADLAANRHTEEFFVGFFHKIGAINPNLAPKGNFPHPPIRIERVIRQLHFAHAFEIVDYNLHRIEYRHPPRRGSV